MLRIGDSCITQNVGVGMLTITRRPTEGYERRLAPNGCGTEVEAASSQVGEEEAVAALQFVDGPVTDQRPVSIAGWGAGLLIGAGAWAAILVWLN